MGSNLLPLGFAAWLIILILQSSITYANVEKKEGPQEENGVVTTSDSHSSKEPGQPPPLPKDPRYLAVVHAALNYVKATNLAVWERIKRFLPDGLKVPGAITNMFHKLGSSRRHKPSTSPEPPVSSESGSPREKSKEEDISDQESSVDQNKQEASSQQEQEPVSAQQTESPSETVNYAQPSAQELPPPAYEPSPPGKEPTAAANEPSKPAKELPPSANEPSSQLKESPPPANEPSSPPEKSPPPANEPSSPLKEPPPPAKEPTSPPKESPPSVNEASPPAKEAPPASDSSTPDATPTAKTGLGFQLSSNWRTPSPVNNQSPPPSPPSTHPHSSHDYSSYSLSSFEKPPYGSSAYDDYKRAWDYLEYLKKIVYDSE